MSKKFTIVIEVEGGTHNVVITDDAGNRKECNSCVVSGGCKGEDEVYLFAWGHPRDSAWSLAEGMSRGQANPWWGGFIQSLTREMAFRTLKMDTVRPGEVLDSWEKEEKTKKVGVN